MRSGLRKLALLGLVLIALYSSWRVIEPLVGAVFFGIVTAYALYPLHTRLSRKIGRFWSALALTLFMVALGVGMLVLMIMISINLLNTFYHEVGAFLNWLETAPLPSMVSNFVSNFKAQLMPKLADYVSSFTFSVPGYVMRFIVFLLVLYYSLAYGRDIVGVAMSLIPPSKKELGLELFRRVDGTMNALVRAWLLLNVAKSFLMTLGYIIFRVSNLYMAITAGFLTFVFSFVPLLEGWMLWVAAAVYFVKIGAYLKAIGIAVYGALLVSPMPDYTIRPLMIARDTELDETLVFLGMVGGTLAMGLKGLLIGPIVLNLALVLLDEWKDIMARQGRKDGKKSGNDARWDAQGRGEPTPRSMPRRP
ncbi:MAG: AI-2E family transporter [Thermococci archaeon]|nr:AI-2E family transporter [Thermococci archaeon]